MESENYLITGTMPTSITWTPELALQERILSLASQRGLSPETLITEAVRQYIETMSAKKASLDADPLIGLFASSSDLAITSEDILQKEIKDRSGWTWK